jgi:hypothetical protein
MSVTHEVAVPAGFDELHPEEQLQYVEKLLERVESSLAGRLDAELIAETRRRRERHRLHPDEAEPASVVKARLLAKYR